ncbi:27203_t:CDS:2, partial [Racocetra persica]
PFTKTIERLEGSQYSTISYVYPAIQKIKSRLSCSFDPINENNDSQDELEDAFDDLQFEDEKENDEPKAKQRIKINNLVNTIGLINAIKGKLYHAINVYYEDLELDKENSKYYITSLSVRKESKLLQKRLKTKLYGESLFGKSSFDSCGSGNGDEIDRYLVLQEISKDQNA